ncbi:hypothetical protein KL930_001819 [Ogataea haglerorum]|uniref:Uncharacterized protein n=1 Tax=Ogataea haglerorum TaxID=1937702 RepID=A0ABQ7RK32_9ASCO|nr:uncharacterized protein KL911_001760 [Ogataea haglerorum]KAG7698157.1 hypothetical protein KL915_001874 [Ogataea haglerorum]KAG7699549.1 hypothetical protein KL951_001266 [Ogataea haglerorum]KAG7708378.1 hypothetical protein KL914_002104 [Ogataea haglerorum]KAG7710594.1 hypothetical protein KL950_001507 [Ogataea haglerorum]KAG7740255.1 hypothetical protein KL923_002096 [Ogataea haglerorum]
MWRLGCKSLEKLGFNRLMRYARTLLRSGTFLARAAVLTARPTVHSRVVQRAPLTQQSVRCNSISARTDGADIPESVRNLTMEQYDTSASETLESIYCDLDEFFDEHNIADADVEESVSISRPMQLTPGWHIDAQHPTGLVCAQQAAA